MPDNKKSSKATVKRLGMAVAVFVLMWASFGAGLYATGKSAVIKDLAKQEVVYTGKILGKYSEPTDGKLSQDVDFSLFWQVWDSLYANYVDKDKLNEKKLFYGAIKGMVSAVGDPYTVFMDPKISEEFQSDLAGTFEGIGAEIGIKTDVLTIIAPLPETPAEQAGLMAGDKVVAIDGTSTQGITVDEAVNKIRGPKGSEVVLSIVRDGVDGVKDYTIKRDQIVVKSVRTQMRDDGIFVVTITNFNNDTKSGFDEAVREILDKNPKGIIIDLRNNPGGYLDTAIEIASEWVENNIVVTEKYTDDRKFDHLSRGRARLAGYKTVVLVNQGSASASEIVSGALQDYGLATLVGEKTFGKGSVQTVTDFGDGSSVKITVAKWLTPNGRSINDEGIEPNVVVDLTPEDFNAGKDPQMEAAIDIIDGKPVPQSNNATSTDSK